MITISDEIKLRADISTRLVEADTGLDLAESIEYADIIVDMAIKKSLNIRGNK